ncbi:DUF488 family protein [Frateuria sp. STR12]|uniref:DUF488 domain-containing protein n=1 Tax=Frateuria hangzhouensis TaxID=2995589 RepID=UPI002260AC05|nr:DUF488 domain-containing protein [Frateuria sp. STR12]MCX7512582.1 DUF488 domain-containing protein [Frateuria sp. STR12]
MPGHHPALPVFGIGHSTHPLGTFVELLQGHAIECVVDVRRLPGSRRFPQYDGPALAASLEPLGIDYLHMPPLGGRRGRSLPAGAPSPNGFWENASFRRYADYAMSEDFHDGFAQLLELASQRRCTLMCAEVLWWRCHRRIIADYLLAAGRTVCHIKGDGRAEPARMTPAAQREGDHLVYPPQA